jgi:hypothetical protein
VDVRRDNAFFEGVGGEGVKTVKSKIMNWKDTTSRSQQNPNAPASCWSLETKKLRITVLNGHRDDPGEWVISCHQVNFSVKRLGIKSESKPYEAKQAALDLVKKELREMLESLEK